MLTAAALVLFMLTGQQICFVRVVEASSRSVDSTYDTSKGVFSPQGRLIQMDYIEVRYRWSVLYALTAPFCAPSCVLPYADS